MSTEQELNKVLTAVREWRFQDLMAEEAMLTAESKDAEANDVAYAIGRKAQADEAWLDLIARLRALLAEMEEAREDAARYRWLRDDSRECPRNIGEIYVTQHSLPNDEDSMDHDLFMDALDAAIDAARKGEA